MTRARYNKNPKLTREQLLEVVKLEQMQVRLLLNHLEVAYKKIHDQEEELEDLQYPMEVAFKKIRDQEDELEVANMKIRDQEEEIRSFLRTMEQNDNDLETFLEHEIRELEEELECPVCLEVAKTAPIYKCQEDHLVCRSQTLLQHQEFFFVFRQCRPKLEDCPQCRASFYGPYKRFGWHFTSYYICLSFGSTNE